jgi:hypothetical protein
LPKTRKAFLGRNFGTYARLWLKKRSRTTKDSVASPPDGLPGHQTWNHWFRSAKISWFNLPRYFLRSDLRLFVSFLPSVHSYFSLVISFPLLHFFLVRCHSSPNRIFGVCSCTQSSCTTWHETILTSSSCMGTRCICPSCHSNSIQVTLHKFIIKSSSVLQTEGRARCAPRADSLPRGPF